jgi:ribose transport system ATP-binding protein
VAMAVACVNVALIRVLKLSSIIATLATYSILWGISLRLRHQPGGHISDRFTHGLLTKIGFVPVAFIGIIVIAVAADIWLYRSAGGLAARAMGLDEESAKRRGVRVGFLFVRAFFLVAFAAAISSFFMAANAQIGDPNYGIPYTLTSISAAVLGGASLLGGRGSFVGAVVGALFVNMITTVLPFLGWSNARGQIAIGVLTLLALSFYQAPELSSRMRTAFANFKLSRATGEPAADAA